jgi:molybdate transport system regulatory protein
MRLEPRVKLFLSGETIEGAFGGGKWHLLTVVREEGSLQRAARRLGRSYRKAWGDIKRAEEGLGRVLVTRSRGGSHGGGATVLTPFGEKLLAAWDEYHGRVTSDAQRHFDRLLAPLLRQKRRG